MNEIEVKILDIDKAAILARLREIGAELVKDEAQVNTIYDYPDLRLLGKKAMPASGRSKIGSRSGKPSI